MSNKPITTLFMLMSLDGKINSGASDNLDVDKDWNKIDGVKEGLHQYYEIEQTTDEYSLNTGKVMDKIGVNTKEIPNYKMGVSFVLIDSKPHLTEKGVIYLCEWLKKVYIVTSNSSHPAFALKEKYSNLEIIFHIGKIDLEKLMIDLKENYEIEKITIQSGGTLNGAFLRSNLIDYVNIVIAPVLVGGKDTNTLIDGESITNIEELNKIKAMQLLECNKLEDSYIQLKYKVIK